MRKIFINIVLIILGFLLYFFQSNFFSWFTIAGIKPNLFVIYILFIGLFGNKTMGAVYGIVLGALLDLIFNEKIGANLICLPIVGIIAIAFDKNFSKDSRITIILMVFATTTIFETVVYINYVLYSCNIEIFNFVKILIIEVIYNILITIIMYPLIQKFGYYIENEYKGNKILTRYF